MKVTTQGWSRFHGIRTLLNKSISQNNIGFSSKAIYMGQVYARVLDVHDGVDGVEITFGTDVQLGGRQFVRLHIPGQELMALLDACTRPPQRISDRSLRLVPID